MRAKGALALEVSISGAEGSGCVEGVVEAETENTVLVLESGNGTLLETLHRNTKDGLVREVIKGRALRNRDMVVIFVFRKYKLDNGYPVTNYPLEPLECSEFKQKIRAL